MAMKWRWKNWEKEWLEWLQDPVYRERSGLGLLDAERLARYARCGRIDYTDYALKVMEKRGIGEALVEEVLASPDQVLLDTRKRLLIACKKLDRRLVVVVFDAVVDEEKGCGSYIVVDAMALRASREFYRAQGSRWRLVKVA